MNELLSDWQKFLAQCGANFSNGPVPRLIGFSRSDIKPVTSSDFVAPLDDSGLIAVTGEEAIGFLHNQLTNDVENLSPTEARLGGYCSPKGRLLATMLYWRSGQDILLQLPRPILSAVQKRLQMFVLRAKVKLRDASAEHLMLGLTGPAAIECLRTFFPEFPEHPYDKRESEAGTLIRMADADEMPRLLWITASATAIKAWPLLMRNLRPSTQEAWALSEIHAGIPWITSNTQEQFVPQMINFELIGGVNFRKGCYPGQEIVARSQYLGKLKRRMLLTTVDSSEAVPGMEVFASADPGQPCGMIVNAENNEEGKMDCLVEIKIATANGSIRLASSQGPELQFKPLPYPLPDPIG